jgi:hypothetical protein
MSGGRRSRRELDKRPYPAPTVNKASVDGCHHRGWVVSETEASFGVWAFASSSNAEEDEEEGIYINILLTGLPSIN